ncbi:SDR family NAD(P)-dependent oxidoreductase [Arthrobacter sp. zg-Y20]|uniref:SDR family oxidoreductase n=1 Tax=unclassified Arthrobacter TaxID=235627 RepID=UPI001D149AD3|nr:MULTISPECIES: SDR family NAD(P)-dependent oxidoreductase [unclassified Arthrobacter]MCC3275134.1 SDR family NAD(P)-dependent oxidoreductase [Arthrobacter sp. zg-Y20]MDK1315291.1 SDR family NAD(P)-dependent oxidoreductase [Arthrobacter sp. zg.Y20]WIB05717.1 SDR family NAD(P)-dependent oxidoreductase [Arthrobacter sp. zg-Y20]
MNINGNTIFIPGATSGIGLALAVRLQTAGNTVIIGGRRTEVLELLAAEHGFATVAVDTTDPASVLAARDTVLAGHPDLNVLIAMAGIMTGEDMRSESFLAGAERLVETNINGPLRLVAAFIEHLQTRPDAVIMTVSSGLAHTPLANTPTYNGTKAFIHRFSEGLRLQLAGTSVQVIELVPPAVRTELMPGGSVNEHYLPLDAFADEVMALLQAQPDAHEILVEAVKFLRFAETEGRYDAAVAAINPAVPA